ncbi:MAG TPA: tetratricopeptide repeat protein, partial [Fimbriimonadaceae bacterium]|nr:tetratricopeptide repeat protein [Fimbriimonadaceae bacterium]
QQCDVSMRYRLTSTFREYVLGKWPEPAPLPVLEKAHAHCYHERIASPEDGELSRDMKNFARAIDFFVKSREPESATEIVLYLSGHWVNAGLYAEGARAARACLATGPEDGRLLNVVGVLEYYLGQFGESGAHLTRAGEIASASGDQALRSKSMNNLSLLYMSQGDTDAAIASLEEALPYDRAQSDPSKLIISLSNLGYLFTLKGDLPRARELLEEALQMTGRLDDRRTAIPCLVNLSDLALEERDTDGSSSYANRGMAYAEELNDAAGAACCLTNLGEVELQKGNFEEAEALLRRALTRAIDIDASWLMGSILDLLAIVFWRRGRLEPTTVALVHRQVASTVPSPARFAAEVGQIFAVVETEVGSEELARMRHRAEKHGIAAILDDLPRG